MSSCLICASHLHLIAAPQLRTNFCANPTLAKPRLGPELSPLLRSWLSYELKVRAFKGCGVRKYIIALIWAGFANAFGVYEAALGFVNTVLIACLRQAHQTPLLPVPV
jgi:hypothetical protein